MGALFTFVTFAFAHPSVYFFTVAVAVFISCFGCACCFGRCRPPFWRPVNYLPRSRSFRRDLAAFDAKTNQSEQSGPLDRPNKRRRKRRTTNQAPPKFYYVDLTSVQAKLAQPSQPDDGDLQAEIREDIKKHVRPPAELKRMRRKFPSHTHSYLRDCEGSYVSDLESEDSEDVSLASEGSLDEVKTIAKPASKDELTLFEAEEKGLDKRPATDIPLTASDKLYSTLYA